MPENRRLWGITVSEGLEHGNRGDFPGPGKSCNQGNKSGAPAHGYSARCSLSAPSPGLCTAGIADAGDWLPGLPTAIVRPPPPQSAGPQRLTVRASPSHLVSRTRSRARASSRRSVLRVVSGRWHVAACKSGRSGSLTRSVMPM